VLRSEAPLRRVVLEAALGIPSATQMVGPSTLRFNSGRATTGPLKEMIKEMRGGGKKKELIGELAN
jgi:hypothetical protein